MRGERLNAARFGGCGRLLPPLVPCDVARGRNHKEDETVYITKTDRSSNDEQNHRDDYMTSA